MMGMPKTPTEGDAYEGGVGSETTRRELQVRGRGGGEKGSGEESGQVGELWVREKKRGVALG